MGGTFDPVHCGHLRAALEVLESCRLGALRLVPAAVPPHRAQPIATPGQRLRLLRAAVSAEARLAVDARELARAGPSWTIDTLRSLRSELPATPLCLVLGADAFLGLESWRDWRAIFTLAHLIVIPRPGVPLAPAHELAAEFAARRATTAACLGDPAGGAIIEQPVTPLGISASAIRALLAAGGDPRWLVPDAVRDILLEEGFYKNAAPAANTEV